MAVLKLNTTYNYDCPEYNVYCDITTKVVIC